MSRVGRLLKPLRDAWLIVGISAILFGLLEGGLSVAYSVRDRFEAEGPGDPPGPPWAGEYRREFLESQAVRWEPYVYWRRRPYEGRHITVDPRGLRVTPPAGPRPEGTRAPLKVFVFGGSTVWGTGARDHRTIPALLGQELRRKGLDAEVTNFGESGYVSTQGLLMLIKELQAGRVPDLAIFYDGANDTYSAFQQRVAGRPQNEFNRANEFNLSQPTRAGDRARLVLRDVSSRLSTVRLLKAILDRAGLRGGATAGPTAPGVAGPADAALAGDVAAAYRANIRIAHALGMTHGFRCLFYWQPTVFQKPSLAPAERPHRDTSPEFVAFVGSVSEAIASGLGPCVDGGLPFRDLGRVFDRESGEIFTDFCHMNEEGNERIALEMAGDVLALLAGPAAPPAPAAPDG